ncbi:DNA cytosine methyltransferase [Lysinibacillus fusiformis]|uniref:Cytosine-specific methyltransferase n=1 Tax=Lysinibacillus fusiformis TaxID=28031 RepID=E5LGB2_9BACI|nr:DNA cytosine methyltransferase [Lysinibacillus fusiformis]ADQ20500.1 M1.BfuAI [Lysinibacillus fusiformis]QSB10847.1 DNA cytosine methyltransferase [Lysinibacillus fusiformis]
MRLNAVDLFSGAGGLLQGLLQTDYNVLFSVEIDKAAVRTHLENFPDIPVFDDDIRNLTKEKMVELTKNSEIDLVVGGPPCQGFSVFGKRRFINTQGYNPKEDDRNKLVYEFIRVVRELKPKYFFMENVKGFLSLDKGLFVEEVIKEFKSLGYDKIEYKVFCAADYGVPQKRYRMLMIGNRLGQDIIFPEPTHSENPSLLSHPYKTVGQAIMDLVNFTETDIPNHVPLKHKDIVSERMAYVKEGSKLNIEDLPEHLLQATRVDSKTGKVKNYSHIYKRLHRELPSNTLVPGHNAFPIHPTLNRTLTVREAARIQTFPDTHVFFGTRQQQCIQVGNAVPPLMAKPFFEQIKNSLSLEKE